MKVYREGSEYEATLRSEDDLGEFTRRMDCLDWFRGEMARKLEERIDRGDWGGPVHRNLLSNLIAEVAELTDEIVNSADPDCQESFVIQEAVDVANYALMIADVARRRK